MREKYFSLRPKPLEKWLWQQGLPPSAERVFWLHWEEGMRAGDWCSSLPLSKVARECCLDVSTVTRAYQVLKGLELIRREEPPRDPEQPFLQVTAVTEVRIPRELLVELGRYANRSTKVQTPQPEQAVRLTASIAAPSSAPTADIAIPPSPTQPSLPRLKHRDFQHILARLSGLEKLLYARALADAQEFMAFTAETQLTPLEQQYVQQSLLARAEGVREAAKPAVRSTPAPLAVSAARPAYAGPRRLGAFELVRCRKRLSALVPTSELPEVWRQIVWSVEEGALRRFEPSLAVNIALKKLREGAWTRPNRLPPQWQVGARASAAISLSTRAQPETCQVA